MKNCGFQKRWVGDRRRPSVQLSCPHHGATAPQGMSACGKCVDVTLRWRNLFFGLQHPGKTFSTLKIVFTIKAWSGVSANSFSRIICELFIFLNHRREMRWSVHTASAESLQHDTIHTLIYPFKLIRLHKTSERIRRRRVFLRLLLVAFSHSLKCTISSLFLCKAHTHTQRVIFTYTYNFPVHQSNLRFFVVFCFIALFLSVISVHNITVSPGECNTFDFSLGVAEERWNEWDFLKQMCVPSSFVV